MMQRKIFIGAVLALLYICLSNENSYAQPQSKAGTVEVGGQFSAIHLRNFDKVEPGFGGRFTYNVTDYLGLEAETNFFPKDRLTEGGRKTQGLFGVKAGKRFETIGLFGKARPGFMHFSKGTVRSTGDQACILIFPPPERCIEVKSISDKTAFAMDIGGVIEMYPSKRTIVRFNFGDTILHFGRNTIDEQTRKIRDSSFTRHNFQATLGVSFRF